MGKTASLKKTNADSATTLRLALSDTYALMATTQNFHWNVKGPNFISLHKLFEEQYDEMNEAIDELAERLRALREEAPTLAEMTELSSLKAVKRGLNAKAMLEQLRDGQKIVIESLKRGIEVAESEDDKATADMLTGRLEAHGKQLWMIEASLA